MGDLVRLPLDHGSLSYVSVMCSHVRHCGWTVRVWHRHEGESDLCEPHTEYEGLTVDELVDVVASTLACVDERFVRDGEGCHAQPPLPM